jgi:hypothetical protein
MSDERTKNGRFKPGHRGMGGRPKGAKGKEIDGVDRELARHVKAWREHYGEYFEEIPSPVKSLLLVAEEQMRRILQLRGEPSLSSNQHKLLNSSANSLRQTLQGATALVEREMKIMERAERLEREESHKGRVY